MMREFEGPAASRSDKKFNNVTLAHLQLVDTAELA